VVFAFCLPNIFLGLFCILMNLARIKAVTFGAPGVLVRPAPSVGAIYQDVLKKKGLLRAEISVQQIDSHYQEVSRRWHKDNPQRWNNAKNGKALWQNLTSDVLSAYCPSDRIKSVTRELWEAFSKPQNWEEIPGSRPVLEILSTCGYTLGVLSNTDSRLSKKILKSLGLATFFQEIFLSSDIGFSKPDLRLFEYARGVLDLAPHEILHVGSRMIEDVEGSRHAGWQAALLGGLNPNRADILYLERLTDLVDLLPQSSSQNA
jgi:REG-2-like HAD superfamily hydrolase